jgi:hypothetical protein
MRVDAIDGGECDRFFGEAGLAGACLADNEQQSAAPGGNSLYVRAQLPYLTLTADEHPPSVEATVRDAVGVCDPRPRSGCT